MSRPFPAPATSKRLVRDAIVGDDVTIETFIERAFANIRRYRPDDPRPPIDEEVQRCLKFLRRYSTRDMTAPRITPRQLCLRYAERLGDGPPSTRAMATALRLSGYTCLGLGFARLRLVDWGGLLSGLG